MVRVKPGEGLPALWKFLVRGPVLYTDSLAASQRCPVCASTRHVPFDVRTMRVFPTLEGGFLFRCPRCGGCYDALEMVRRVKQLSSYEEAESLLWHTGVIAEPCTPQELSQHERYDQLMRLSERGQRSYDYWVKQGKWGGRAFGEWAVIDGTQLASYLPGGRLPKGTQRDRYLVQRLRNVFGRPSSLVLCGMEGHFPIGSVALGPKEPVELATDPAFAQMEIGKIILAASSRTAGRLQQAVMQWPEEERLPVAYPYHLDAPALSWRLPFSRIWQVVREDERVAEGLAFLRPHETDVRCKELRGKEADAIDPQEPLEPAVLCREGLPDALSVTAARIVQGETANFGHRLQHTLGRRYIADTIKKALLEKCAELSGKPVLALVEEAGIDASPYAVLNKGRRFLCRNAIYVLQDRKGEWRRASNFSLRIIRRTVDEQGDADYELLLNVEDHRASFRVTAAVLDSAPRLWKAARRCGELAGLPELDMPNAQHRQLLPSLVKRTKGL